MKHVMIQDDRYFRRTFFQVGKRVLIKSWDKTNCQLSVCYYTLYPPAGWFRWKDTASTSVVRLIQFDSPSLIGCEVAARGNMRQIGKTAWFGRWFLEDLTWVFGRQIGKEAVNG